MLCLGCVSKVNSENDEYQSCVPCLGNICSNLVPRVFRKDPGIGWSRASSKIDRPRGCGESIKLQTVKNINFANKILANFCLFYLL
jgi:hypothetical protein